MRWEKHNIEHDRSVTGQEEKEHLKPPTTNFGLCNNKKEPIPKYTIGFGGVLWDSPKILGVDLVEELHNFGRYRVCARGAVEVVNSNLAEKSTAY